MSVGATHEKPAAYAALLPDPLISSRWLPVFVLPEITCTARACPNNEACGALRAMSSVSCYYTVQLMYCSISFVFAIDTLSTLAQEQCMSACVACR